MSEIIVLSGFARTGKDTAAAVLVESFGFKQIAFADKLREAVYALNPLIRQSWTSNIVGELVSYDTHLQDVIDAYGWNGYKESVYSDEVRRLLQRGGTEMGRQTLGKNIWVDALLNDINPEDDIVIPDGRFFNEFDAVIGAGGYVWRIDRAGVGPLNDHASEMEAINYPNFSLRLNNNGTKEGFEELVRREYVSGRYKEWSFA